MTTDVKLDENFVLIEGNALKVKAWDIMLDSPDRRLNAEGATNPYRRALVHDHADRLTINYRGDYPGGVKIQGQISAEGIKCDWVKVGELNVTNTLSELHNQLQTVLNQTRLIEGIFSQYEGRLHAQLSGNVHCNGLGVRENITTASMNLHGRDLDEWLRGLEEKINDLAHRVSMLEG